MDEPARAEVALLLYCRMVSLVTVGSSPTAVCLLLSAYCSQPATAHTICDCQKYVDLCSGHSSDDVLYI